MVSVLMYEKFMCFAVIGIALALIASNPLNFEAVKIGSVNAQNENNAFLKENQESNPNYKSGDLMSTTPKPTPTGSATLSVAKVVRCNSDLGLPSNKAVCQFVLDSVYPSQFTLTVAGNNSSVSFQGSINGTKVSLYPGAYSVSETPFDTSNIENQLGEATTGTISTAAVGHCTANFAHLDTFQNATGTISSEESQTCTIINTIGITSGLAPGGP
jgi:hypothetical protein